jgi:hypothetical protein
MVKEKYFEHMGFALRFSLRMIGGGVGGLVHAFIPALFQTTASTVVRTLHKEMEDRFARQKK